MSQRLALGLLVVLIAVAFIQLLAPGTHWSTLLMGGFSLVGLGYMVWMSYLTVKSDPQAFAKANISQSFTTVGLLALALLAFISLLIVFLR